MSGRRAAAAAGGEFASEIERELTGRRAHVFAHAFFAPLPCPFVRANAHGLRPSRGSGVHGFFSCSLADVEGRLLRGARCAARAQVSGEKGEPRRLLHMSAERALRAQAARAAARTALDVLSRERSIHCRCTGGDLRPRRLRPHQRTVICRFNCSHRRQRSRTVSPSMVARPFRQQRAAAVKVAGSRAEASVLTPRTAIQARARVVHARVLGGPSLRADRRDPLASCPRRRGLASDGRWSLDASRHVVESARIDDVPRRCARVPKICGGRNATVRHASGCSVRRVRAVVSKDRRHGTSPG